MSCAFRPGDPVQDGAARACAERGRARGDVLAAEQALYPCRHAVHWC